MSDEIIPPTPGAVASPWQALLANATAARQRVATLLADSAAPAIVPHLPADDFYYLVKALGLGDASDLLELAAHFDEPDDFVTLPVPFAAPLGEDSFLNRALARIDDVGTVEELTVRLLMLLNRVLTADRVDVADVDGVRTAIERGRDTLSLGLEYVAAGDLARAAAALTTIPLVEIFQVGHSLTLDLRRRAQQVQAAGVAPLDLEPLLATRPQFPGALDDVPHAGTRPFRTVADLERVATFLDGLADRIQRSE